MIFRTRRYVLFLSLAFVGILFFPVLAQADILSRNFSLTYEVKYNGTYLGDSVRTFRKSGDNTWQYASTTQAKGFVSLFITDVVRETSTIRQQGTTIMPLRYEYSQTGGKKSLQYQIDFDRDQGIIHNSHEQKELKLESNAQDLLSFQLQLMRDLQQRANTITYFIPSRRRAAAYVLTHNGSKKIDTPLKTLETVELASNKLKEHDQYRIWCAVSLEYLPVRIEKIEADGDRYEFVIKHLAFD